MVEYAFMLPLMIVATVAVFSLTIYTVTQYALAADVAEAVGRAVQVAPRTSASRYCQAIEAFVHDALDSQTPFYARYVENLRTTRVSIDASGGTADQRVLTVRREGDFALLNLDAWNLALTVTGEASAVLPVSSPAGSCGLPA